MSKKYLVLLIIALPIEYLFYEDNIKLFFIYFIFTLLIFIAIFFSQNIIICKNGIRISFVHFIKWKDVKAITRKRQRFEDFLLVEVDNAVLMSGINSRSFLMYVYKRKKIIPKNIYQMIKKELMNN